jgi:hypothetical protein
VLRRLRDPAVYDELERRAARLADGLAPFGRVQRVGAMLTLFVGRAEPVERFVDLDTDAYAAAFRGLLDRGVYVAPSQYECLFPSLAHGDEEIDATIEAVADWEPIFSPLAPTHLALGLETVYEGYLTHYGRPRLFSPPDTDEAVLLGDYLYAHGLVRVAEAGGVDAVAVLADLISRCAALRADGADGDGDAWVDAARRLGGAPDARAVAGALARHSARVAP